MGRKKSVATRLGNGKKLDIRSFTAMFKTIARDVNALSTMAIIKKEAINFLTRMK